MTDLEIVNRALGFLGETGASSMTDQSRGPKKAITAYPMCRDEVLRKAPWTCCMKRDRLYDTGEQATPWTANRWYGVGERVTNDTLKTYVCTVDGRSATSGGPTGTGTAITDGTVTWMYLEVSSAATNWCHWTSTPYNLGDLVCWDGGKIYECIQAGTSESANPPIGTAQDILDGTVRWRYYTTIPANRTIYAYQYVLPPDCLYAAKVPDLAAAKESQQGVQYSVEGRMLYTAQAASILRYVWRADPLEWDPLLEAAVAMRIVAEIALDLTGQKPLMSAAFEVVKAMYDEARSVALSEGQEGVEEEVRWEDA